MGGVNLLGALVACSVAGFVGAGALRVLKLPAFLRFPGTHLDCNTRRLCVYDVQRHLWACIPWLSNNKRLLWGSDCKVPKLPVLS